MGERSAQNDGMTPIQETPRKSPVPSRSARAGRRCGPGPGGPVRRYRAGASSGRAGSRDRRPPRRVPARGHRLGPRHDLLRRVRWPTAASSPATSSAVRSRCSSRRPTVERSAACTTTIAAACSGSSATCGTVQWVWAIDASDRCGGLRAVRPRRRGSTTTSSSRTVRLRHRLASRPADPWSRSTPQRGSPSGNLSPLALGGAWPVGPAGTTNANGIRELPDGSLVLNNSRVGGLWQVDAATGVARAIPVNGGPGLIGGDGLEIDGTHALRRAAAATRARSPSCCSAVRRRVDGEVGRRPQRRDAGRALDGHPRRRLALGRSTPGSAPRRRSTIPYWITRLPAK